MLSDQGNSLWYDGVVVVSAGILLVGLARS